MFLTIILLSSRNNLLDLFTSHCGFPVYHRYRLFIITRIRKYVREYIQVDGRVITDNLFSSYDW